MSEWKPDLRHQKTIGAFTLTPERRGNETAHLIESTTGRGLRALPSDDISGLRRSRVIVGALLALDDVKRHRCEHDDQDHPDFDPFIYLVGALDEAILDWEWVEPESFSIEEWVSQWTTDVSPKYVLDDLARAGYKIVRAE